MLKGAIIDENIKELSHIYSLINNELKKYDIIIELKKYSDSAQFEYQFKYDVLFLEIDMSIDGINLAKKVKQFHKNTIIIFISHRHDRVFDTFQVHPYDFIKKNECQTSISATIKEIVNKFNQDYIFISIKTKEGLLKVCINQILYIESMNHRCIIHTINKDLTTYMKLSNIENQLDQFNFLRIHQSIIVNFQFVTAYCKNYVQINQYELPISRSRIKK